MFLGEYQHTLDSKGRLILPAAFREELKDGVVITIGVDRCLTVHPKEDWERVLAGLRAMRTTDARERMFQRMLTSSAHAEEADRQGRINVPARLREYASLSRDVTIVGADMRLELWDSGAWEGYREQALSDFASTDKPFDLGGIF